MKRVRKINKNGHWVNIVEFDERDDEIIRQGWHDPKVCWRDLVTSIGASASTIKRRGQELGLGEFAASNSWHHSPEEMKSKKEIQKPRTVPSDVEDEIKSYLDALDMKYDNPKKGKDNNVIPIGNFPMPDGFVRSSGIKKDVFSTNVEFDVYEIHNKEGNFECVIKVPAFKYNKDWNPLITKEKEAENIYRIECRALSMVSYLQFIEWTVYDKNDNVVITRKPCDYFKTSKELREQKAKFYVWKMRAGDTMRNHGRKQMSALIHEYKKNKNSHLYNELREELKKAIEESKDVTL